MDHGVVRSIQSLAIPFVGDHRNLAVIFVADDSAIPVLARDLPTAVIERVAIAVAGRMTELTHMTVVFDQAKLGISRNVAP